MNLAYNGHTLNFEKKENGRLSNRVDIHSYVSGTLKLLSYLF
jgi:hypothetical protein